MNWFSKAITPTPRSAGPRPRQGTRPSRSRFRLGLEHLEERAVPTVVFRPNFGTEGTTLGSGEKLNSVPVYLIFWGTGWANGSYSGPTVAQIQSAVNTELASPAFSHLAANPYGTNASAHVQGVWIDGKLGDPSSQGFSDSDLHSLILNAINDPQSPVLAPANFNLSTPPLYVVITPPGEHTSVNSGFGGYHDHFSGATYAGTEDIVYAWVGNNLNSNYSALDFITMVLSHELGEAMTDAQPTSGVSVRAGSGWGTGTDEIGDYEPDQTYTYRVNGVLVQALWDYYEQAFTVGDGNSQSFYITPQWTLEGDGYYHHTGNTLVLYGDQLGAGSADSIYIDVNNSGGVWVDMNNEIASFDASGPSAITAVDVQPYYGQNTITVANANVPVTIEDSGYDTVNLGNGSDGMEGFHSYVQLNYAYGDTALNINDRPDPVARTVWAGNDYVVGLPGAVYFDPRGLRALSVYGGGGGNTFYLYDTPANGLGVTTYLSSGSGYNQVNVLGTTGPLYLDGGSGIQNVTVGSAGPNLGGTLADISGPVDVFNSIATGTSYLTIDDSGDTTGGTATLDASSFTGPSGAAITWSASASATGGVTLLSVYGPAAGSTFNVYDTPDLYLLTVLNTGAGDDTVNVSGTTGTLYVYNAGGQDAVTVGDGTLAAVNGFVDVYGTGSTALFVNDGGDGTARTATLDATSLSGLSNGVISWSASSAATGGVTLLDIAGSAAGSTYTVADTPDLYEGTTLNTGAGDAAVNVTATTGTLNVINGGGSDTVVIGSNAPSASGGTLAAISGLVNVAGAGTTALLVDDSGDPAGHAYTLTADSLSVDGLTLLSFSGVSDLMLNGGNGGNTFTIQGTAAGTSTTVNAGAGNDAFTVGNAADTLDDLQGDLTLSGGPGTDPLTVNDQGSAADETYTLTDTALERSGTALLTYSGLGGLAVNTGSGTDTFAVVSTAPATPVSVNGGGGNDTLVGPDTANTWEITGTNAGSVGNVTFSAIPNLTGGGVSDTFQFQSGQGVTGIVSGGSGFATLDYSQYGTGVTVNLLTGTATGTGGVTGIHNVTGSPLNDTITGDNAGDVLSGNGGLDVLKGGTGNDAFLLAPGQLAGTSVTGGGGSDTLVGANGSNLWTISGAGSGKVNTTVAFKGIANLAGGTGVDVFKFTGACSVAGTISGGGAPALQGDWLDYSAVTYAVTVNLATGAASHVAGGVSGIQDVHGGNYGNTLTGDAQGNILIGGTGADRITGGSGVSLLIGDKGADRITGGSGGDILIGDATTYDPMTAAHEAALMAILAEWQSGNSYATRVSHLKKGGGLNGSAKLLFGTTVKDDLAADQLTGAAPAAAGLLDWFFKGSGDKLTGVEAGEQVN
jgi:Ca2+-binding RTX toxin-like protein